jgi:hypothetical protein
MDTLTSYLNWNIVTAALAVIGLLIAVLLAFRAFSGTVRGRRGARLAISEYHEVDKTRRLVLVRRDGIEHLLMIGGAQDLVIETGIGLADADVHDDAYLRRMPAGGPVLAPPPPPRRVEEPPFRRDEEESMAPPVPLRPAPRPPVFGDKSPPKLRPVGRDEPRLASVRDYGDEEKS